MTAMLQSWVLSTLVGCGGPADAPEPAGGLQQHPRIRPVPVDEDPCADPGSWETTGQPFVLTWCTGCHSDGREGMDRYGAPDGVDLDTLEDVRSWEARILARVEEGTMPPGGGPNAGQKARLAQWFSCGAPGSESRLEGAREGVGPAASQTVLVSTTSSGSFEGATAWLIQEGDYRSGVGEVTRVVEVWEVDGADAWLWSRELRDESGTTIQRWSWEPPLPVGRADTDAWSAVVTQRLEHASGDVSSEDQDWEFTRTPAGMVDGWSIETAPDRVIGLSDGGHEEGWDLSPDYGISARWWLDADGAGVVYQQALEQEPRSTIGGFPLTEGDRRGGRIVELEVLP